MIPVQKIINKIDTLKPMPQAANQIMTLAENSESSLSDIADIIRYEPFITANLLKICNSSYFGLSRQIDSVHDAVTLLGLDQIIDLVILQYAAEALKKEQAGYKLGEGELWKQSISSALIAKEIAEKRTPSKKHLIFTATLLKDIGKVVLCRYVEFSFKAINNLVIKDGLSFEEAEKDVIGIDHPELGAKIAEKWMFSPKIVYIIRNHHMANKSARQDLETSIVYLADTVSMMVGVGGGCDGPCYKFYEDIFRQMDITEKDLEEIMAGYKKNEKKIEGLLKMV